MNAARKRVLRRAVKGLVSLLVGGAVAAVASPEFRDFLGDSDLAVIAYALVPPLVLSVDKWWRDRKSA